MHRIGRIGIESKQRLGRHRWVVERTFAWLAQYRRLSVRWERRADIHRALLTLGCSMIRWKRLTAIRNAL
jgi:transposase